MPASNFYSYQGQTQHSGFRQGQQPSQLNSLGYPNFYHSQIPTGAQDHHQHHHQQNPGDVSLSGGAQGATQQPPHQLWQNTYWVYNMYQYTWPAASPLFIYCSFRVQVDSDWE